MLRFRYLFFVLLIAGALAGANETAIAQTATASPGQGFIYGTVTWPSGESKTGYLRWKDEEAYWDDLFQCGYRDLVWSEYVDLDEMRKTRRDEYFKTHGLLDRIAYALEGDNDNPVGWRMFASRFGDLVSIEIHDGDDDFALTADGGRHEIGGFGNDSGSPLLLYVAGEESERIRWNDLAEIVFAPAPDDEAPYAERLYGRLETQSGMLEGYIQWDKSECTSLDILDAESEDGDEDYEMGEIRAISRTRENTVEVELKTGERKRLHGSNDVNSGNRGIMVEVAGLGRVTVPWNRYDRLEFIDDMGSGNARTTYANKGDLRGRVTMNDGNIATGRLVLDLDEAFAWDLFNGNDEAEFEYDIPLHNISKIEPGRESSCRLTLVSGQVLELDGDQDTGDGNGGLLVFETAGAPPKHLAWSRIRSIELDR